MNHEKLVCYKELMRVAEELAKKVTKWPRGYGYLAVKARTTGHGANGLKVLILQHELQIEAINSKIFQTESSA